MADIMNLPIKVAAANETCAAGAAMFASVAAGVHDKVEDAQKAMGQGFLREYTPNPHNVKVYDELYKKYVKLGKFTEENM